MTQSYWAGYARGEGIARNIDTVDAATIYELLECDDKIRRTELISHLIHNTTGMIDGGYRVGFLEGLWKGLEPQPIPPPVCGTVRRYERR